MQPQCNRPMAAAALFIRLQPTSKYFKTAIILSVMAVFFNLLGCANQIERDFKAATDHVEKKNFHTAVSLFEKVMLQDPETDLGIKSAREAARISFYENKNYEKALIFYRNLVLSSKDPEERIQAQKQIVSVHFDHINDYPKSVIELSKLLAMLRDGKDLVEFKLKLARAYYYQNNFTQAENETDEFLRFAKDPNQIFDMKMLKGNINVAQKNMNKAIEIFQSIIRDFPDRAAKENVAVTLAVCYEEQKDFKAAIRVLEEALKANPKNDIIEFRLKKLKQRQMNMPGARGFKK